MIDFPTVNAVRLVRLFELSFPDEGGVNLWLPNSDDHENVCVKSGINLRKWSVNVDWNYRVGVPAA